MQELITINTKKGNNSIPKPAWLKIRLPKETFYVVKQTLQQHNLVTVCEEAHCPNMSECWSSGTATFMILGDTCTRGCRFCNVKTAAKGKSVDEDEPEKIAATIKAWKLKYIVLTSVDRDDLPDQGAEHFANCITEIKKQNPGILVEVLIPDFRGNEACLQTILAAKPDVVAHNLETVRSLQKKVRDNRASYQQSLFVLKTVKELHPQMITKSSLMLGLGESEEEILQAFCDLRQQSVDIVTLGQYLQPSSWHLPVVEYVTPEKFAWYAEQAKQAGFLYCASGPLVRSSYKAGEVFVEQVLCK